MSATIARRVAAGVAVVFVLLYVALSLLQMRAKSQQIARERQRLF